MVPADPITPAMDDALIASRLQQSRASHHQKKHAAGRADKAGTVTTPPNYVTTEAHIKDALLARLDAETRDPAHLSPVWYTDQVEAKATSQSLVQFYVTYLTTDRYSSAWDEAVSAMTPEQQARLEQLVGVAR